MFIVTCDTNVWRPLTNPELNATDPEPAAIQEIHTAIRTGRLEARLSETLFTLEGIQRRARRTFFRSYRAQTSSRVVQQPDGITRLGMTIGPDLTAHPGNTSQLDTYLREALELGFRLMRCPRIGGPVNPDLSDEYFVREPAADIGTRQEKFGEVARRIETAGAGRSHLVGIGNAFAVRAGHWFEGIAHAPETENNRIAAAVAEWADGDLVAAHVAYGNHFLCTRDMAARAGDLSVFSAQNRRWLEEDYGVQFVTPTELAARL